MNAVLGNCKRLSYQRNKIIHRVWGIDRNGLSRSERGNTCMGCPPTANELCDLAEEISEQVQSLDYDRLHGFISKVVKASKQSKQKPAASSRKSQRIAAKSSSQTTLASGRALYTLDKCVM